MAEQRHTGNPGNFAEDREKASRAGQIGGQHSSGNFANDRERAAEAGRKGGEHSHGGGGRNTTVATSPTTASARQRLAARGASTNCRPPGHAPGDPVRCQGVER
jgi:general stress protein YciG